MNNLLRIVLINKQTYARSTEEFSYFLKEQENCFLINLNHSKFVNTQNFRIKVNVISQRVHKELDRQKLLLDYDTNI